MHNLPMPGFTIQDLIAWGIVAITAVWLGRMIVRRIFAPPCQPPDTPSESDGFVPLDALQQPARRNRELE
jgi:hypothetical protein